MIDVHRAPWFRPLLLVFLVLALLAFSGHLQWHLKPGWPLQNSEYNKHPFTLLEKLSGELGSEVTSSARLDQIPSSPSEPGRDTLWLSVPGRMLPVSTLADLQQWVEHGGRLVLAPLAPELWENDPLLTPFGVSLGKLSDEELDSYFGPAEDHPLISHDGFFYDWDGESAVQADFDPTWSIQLDSPEGSKGELLLCDPASCHAWHRKIGQGEIFVLTEAIAFDNDRIENFDNAWIATRLLNSKPGSRVTLVYGEAVPSLFELLKTHAPFALLALLAAMLLWMLAASTRFGPLRDGQMPARRRLSEHIHATSRWYVRQGRQRVLWQAVHDDFRRTLHRRHPHAQALDDETLTVLIANHAGIDAQQVRAALAVPVADMDDATLARQIRRLDSLRRLL